MDLIQNMIFIIAVCVYASCVALGCDTAGSSNEDGADGTDADADTDTDADADGDCNPPGAAAGALDDCVMTDLTPTPEQGMSIEFVNDAEQIKVWFVREPMPMSRDFGMILRYFALEQAGLLTCVKEECALEYDYSHHNWFDVINVRTQEGQRHLSLTYQPEGDPLSDWVWTFEFWTTDDTGETIEGPVAVEISACEIMDTGEDCLAYFP